MEIRYSKQAVKFIESLDKTMRNRIKEGIEGLTTMPPKGDIKQLKGYPDIRYRLRVGKFRIIYKYTNEKEMIILNILEVGSRGQIY